MVKDCIFKEHHHKPIMNASRTRISLKLPNQTRSAMTEAKNKRNRSWSRTWDEKVLQPLEWIFWRPSWKKNSNQKIQTNQIIKHKLINLFIQKNFTSTLDQYRKNSSKFIFLQISTIQSTRNDDITCFAKYLKIHKKGFSKILTTLGSWKRCTTIWIYKRPSTSRKKLEKTLQETNYFLPCSRKKLKIHFSKLWSIAKDS